MSESWDLRAAVASMRRFLHALHQASEALRSIAMALAPPIDKVNHRIWWGAGGKIAEALAPNASSRAER